MRVLTYRKTYRKYSENEALTALYDYAYGLYLRLNYTLRQGCPTGAEVVIAEKLAYLESRMELPTLYRATLWRYFEADYAIARKDLRVGLTLKDNGFMSTSMERDIPKEMYPLDKDTVFIRILSTGKHRAIDVNALLGKDSPNAFQKEVILGRGTCFTIIDVIQKDGITYIDVELKSQKVWQQ